MASTDAFSLQYSEFNPFLFADVGTEPNGMVLCVVSVFARLGTDPWTEANRLARLPPDEATRSLAGTIAAMPSGIWPLAEASSIAARLIALLPREKHAPSRPPRRRARFKMPAFAATPALRLVAVVACVMLAALSVVWMTGHPGSSATDRGIVSFTSIPVPAPGSDAASTRPR